MKTFAVIVRLFLFLLFVSRGFAQASAGHEASTAELSAPALGRTASTVLLLWERFAPGDVETYEIRCDGAAVERTKRLSHLVTGLEAGRRYRFSVSALGAKDRLLAVSGEIEAVTKNVGVVLNVKERAAQGDGEHIDTVAIQRAIDACPAGGTVLVPPGIYLVDHLELKSDFTLHLQQGATLRFRGRGEARHEEHSVELFGPDGPLNVSYGSLITGLRTDNVTIAGEGTIQANGESWWPHASQYRPKVLEVIDAKNLLLQGITIEDPPFWNTHPLYVDNLIVAHVTFLRRAKLPSSNGDGLDLDSCRNALVVGCQFGNQDDSIALKSGKLTATQTKRQRPCENITIRDCRFDGMLGPASHPLGIAIGSECCGGVRQVRVRDCEFVNVASVLNLKANRERRHAVVEDVRFENCKYTNTVFPDEPWNRAPIAIDLFYYGLATDPDHAEAPTPSTPVFRDIHFRTLSIKNPAGRGVYISGLAERPVQDISFTDVTVESRTGFFARNVDGLVLDRVKVVPANGPAFEWGVGVAHLREAAR